MEQPDKKFNMATLSEVVKAIVIVSFTIVIAYKLLVAPISLSMDFYALLSLLLALFSVGLSALFYFKATDTSNAFYDNTYKFTKDIAELLVRIESGFGERLRHLDEGYTRMQDRFYPQTSKEEIVETQKQVQAEEENFNTKLKERDKLIEELVQKTQLEGKEKQKFLTQLKDREKELNRLQIELSMLREDADSIRAINQNSPTNRQLQDAVSGYMIDKVIKNISPRLLRTGPFSKLNSEWRELIHNLHPAFVHDLQELGFVNSKQDLTRSGFDFMRQLAFKSKQGAHVEE